MIKSALFSIAFAVCASTALASTLGQATGYNVFVFGNDTQSGSDIGGRTAIGGNYSGSTNFGSAATFATGTYDLVVGGNFTLSNDSVSGGDAFVGGSASITNSNLSHNVASNGAFMAQYSTIYGNLNYATTYSLNGATVQGSIKQGATPAPVDFSGTQASLQTLTGMLNNQALTGTPLIAYNSITLTAQSGLNIFDIDAASLASNSGLTIDAAPGAVNPTVVINVIGGKQNTYSFASAGYRLNGITAAQVLYNFPDAVSLSESGSAVQGSILAPYASFNFANGQVDGQIIVNSITGNGEAHNDLFTGTLPQNPGSSPNTPAAVPEPATLVTIGTALAIAAGWRRIASIRAAATNLPMHKPRSGESEESPNFDIT